MTKQVKHIRKSKYGKKFVAGSRKKVEAKPKNEGNMFDREITLEFSEKDLERIREATGKTDDQIFDKAMEIESSDPNEVIEAFKEDEEDDNEELEDEEETEEE